MCCRAQHLAGFPGIQGIAEPGIWGQVPLLSWGWAKPPPGLKGVANKGVGHPHTQWLMLLPWPALPSSPLHVRGCSSSPGCCWPWLQPCPAELPGRESPSSVAAWSGEAVVEMVAFPSAGGWFRRTLAKLLHQGLGDRCAGLESQPVLLLLVVEGA